MGYKLKMSDYLKRCLCKGMLAGLFALALLTPAATVASGSVIVDVNAGGPTSSAYYTITSYTFTVSGVGVLVDVDFRLSGYHTYANGIWMRLTSPSTTQLVLFNGINPVGSQNVNFQDTYFDDETGIGNFGTTGYRTPPWPGPEHGGAAYKPMYDVLSKFDGENADGTWKLEVYNMYGGDTGYIYQAGQATRWQGAAIGTQLILTPVPEPGTLSLVGILGVCLSGYGLHKRRHVL